jgi:hypothetical protein
MTAVIHFTNRYQSGIIKELNEEGDSFSSRIFHKPFSG